MICPFCKEEVKEDAIKCRHCQSVLVAGVTFASLPEAKPNADGKVTYVVDEGLLRFGKFVAAVFGTFILVGTYLFGIKLELTVEKMRAAQTALEVSTKTLKDREVAAEAANKKLESAEKTAEALVNEIKQNRETAITLIAEMRVRYLQPSEQARLTSLRTSSPEKFREGSANSKLWPIGATLRVQFLDGSPEQKTNFHKALDEWLRYANLHAEYDATGHVQVRVSFAQPGSWAMIGTDSIAVGDSGLPTINLGFVQPGSPPSNYLHEIGHVLGLIHEFKNPTAKLEWDKPHVYESFEGAPNFWLKKDVDGNFFAPEGYPGSRSFDSSSIMMMALPADFFLNKQSFPQNETLSDSDKKYIASLYPSQ